MKAALSKRRLTRRPMNVTAPGYGNTACVTLTICCSMHSNWIRPSPISSWMNFKIAMKCNTASYKMVQLREERVSHWRPRSIDLRLPRIERAVL